MSVNVLPEMACQEFVERITDYLERALPAEDLDRLEAHLSTCSDCRVYLEQMRTTLTLTGRLDADGISEEARDELMRVFRRRSTGEARHSFRP